MFRFTSFFRTEEIAKRRRAQSVENAGLEVEEHRAGRVNGARGPVIKQAGAAERAARHFCRSTRSRRRCHARRSPPPKSLCPSCYRTGSPACEHSRAKKQLGGGEQAGEKKRGGAEKLEKLLVAVWHVKHEMPVARACVSRTGE
jgi:hypothetical protein